MAHCSIFPWLTLDSPQFVASLALLVAVAAATQVDNYAEEKYDTTEVEYQHQYQPQEHTPVVEEPVQQHVYHHQQPTQHVQHVQEPKQRKHIPILKSESVQSKDGSYKYQFETANGIHQHEEGHVKNAGQKDHEIQVAEGFYSYTDEHGHVVTVHYIADENGFRATGDHLPTPPPMPEALREAFAKVAANPELYPEEEEEPEQHHGQYKQQEENAEQTYEQLVYQQTAANHRHHPVHAVHQAPVHQQRTQHQEYAEYQHWERGLNYL